MAYLPFRALGIFFGSLILGVIVAWQVNIWLGLLIIFVGVFGSMFFAVRDVLSELKETVTLARDPKQILVASGLIKSKLPVWLKPIAYFIFNRLLGGMRPKQPENQPSTETTPIKPQPPNPPAA